MNINELLTEMKSETQEYLAEGIKKKGSKFYVVKKNNSDELIAGTKQKGYMSLENAVKAMLSATSKDFSRLSFDKKQKRVNNYIKKWEKENGEVSKKPKKKFGFETLK